MGSLCSKPSVAARVHPHPPAGGAGSSGASARAAVPAPARGRGLAPAASTGGGAAAAAASDNCIQVDGRELVGCSPGGGRAGGGRPARWRKGDAIGAGSFGAVCLGLNTDTGATRARV
jgi:hypothetical protein